MSGALPRIAIIDDLFGRVVPDGFNDDRDNLCASFLLRDVTDQKEGKTLQRIKQPIAEAQFYRGQVVTSKDGKPWVENDLPGTLEFIRQGWIGSGPNTKRWSLVLLDLCFYTGAITGQLSPAVAGKSGQSAEPGMPQGRAEDIVPSQFFGLQVLRAIHAEFPDLPVVILSSQERGKVSQEFSAHGALAFLPRSNGGQGEELLRTYLFRHGLMEDSHGLIVGRSLPLLKALRAARRTAFNEDRENILIRGERGVGKEEFARFIHRVHPKRASQPLVAVNSAVLTSELYSSELFGIEKKVATEVSQREGKAFLAQGGDLFFDEIKDMIPQAQAGILRLLEEGSFAPVGSDKSIEADVRVISATNADLESLAASGRFREDLLDRLRRGGTLVLPPLRERKEDIPLLARLFLGKAETGKRHAAFQRQFSDEAMSYLIDDDWPGNIRVLRDVISRVVKDNDVEYIYPAQIEKAKRDIGVCSSLPVSVAIPGGVKGGLPESPAGADEHVAPSHLVAPEGVEQPLTLAELIATINDFEFDLSNPDALYDQFDVLDEAATKLVVRYLLIGLQRNKKHSTGEVEVLPAIKFLAGDKKRVPPPGKKISTWTSSMAYDLIKRLLKRNPSVLDWALNDPLLKQAYEKAEGNRISNPTKKKTPRSVD